MAGQYLGIFISTTDTPDTILKAKRDTNVKASHYAQRTENFVGKTNM